MYKKLFPRPAPAFGKSNRLAKVRHHRVTTFEAFRSLIERLERAPLMEPARHGQPVYVYFAGNRVSPANPASWCSYCVRSEPIVLAAVRRRVRYPCDFVHVEVGDQTEWRDRSNRFRTDKQTNLLTLPTLMQWRTGKRLDAQWVTQPESLDGFFALDANGV